MITTIESPSATITGDINVLKEWSKEIRMLANEGGVDLNKHLNDMLFSIDVMYQDHHMLDEHNWEIVHTKNMQL
jgi:hypothetical protein